MLGFYDKIKKLSHFILMGFFFLKVSFCDLGLPKSVKHSNFSGHFMNETPKFNCSISFDGPKVGTSYENW